MKKPQQNNKNVTPLFMYVFIYFIFPFLLIPLALSPQGIFYQLIRVGNTAVFQKLSLFLNCPV